MNQKIKLTVKYYIDHTYNKLNTLPIMLHLRSVEIIYFQKKNAFTYVSREDDEDEAVSTCSAFISGWGVEG